MKRVYEFNETLKNKPFRVNISANFMQPLKNKHVCTNTALEKRTKLIRIYVTHYKLRLLGLLRMWMIRFVQIADYYLRMITDL
jgi:hypothetical protein